MPRLRTLLLGRASSVKGALNRGLVREPGSYWEYENYDTLLAVLALKQSFEDPMDYLSYPQTALFGPLGMNSTLASTDRFGDFIFSSQVYTNARDLARFGLLHLNRGEWQGKQLVSKEWIDFMVTQRPRAMFEATIMARTGGSCLIIEKVTCQPMLIVVQEIEGSTSSSRQVTILWWSGAD